MEPPPRPFILQFRLSAEEHQELAVVSAMYQQGISEFAYAITADAAIQVLEQHSSSTTATPPTDQPTAGLGSADTKTVDIALGVVEFRLVLAAARVVGQAPNEFAKTVTTGTAKEVLRIEGREYMFEQFGWVNADRSVHSALDDLVTGRAVDDPFLTQHNISLD